MRREPRESPNSSNRNWPLSAGPSDGAPVDVQAAELMAKLAHQLKNARKLDAQFTQRELARRAGVSRHTLSRIEAGSNWPDLVVLLKLCVALGLRLELVDSATGEPVPTPARDN